MHRHCRFRCRARTRDGLRAPPHAHGVISIARRAALALVATSLAFASLAGCANAGSRLSLVLGDRADDERTQLLAVHREHLLLLGEAVAEFRSRVAAHFEAEERRARDVSVATSMTGTCAVAIPALADARGCKTACALLCRVASDRRERFELEASEACRSADASLRSARVGFGRSSEDELTASRLEALPVAAGHARHSAALVDRELRRVEHVLAHRRGEFDPDADPEAEPPSSGVITGELHGVSKLDALDAAENERLLTRRALRHWREPLVVSDRALAESLTLTRSIDRLIDLERGKIPNARRVPTVDLRPALRAGHLRGLEDISPLARLWLEAEPDREARLARDATEASRRVHLLRHELATLARLLEEVLQEGPRLASDTDALARRLRVRARIEALFDRLGLI